MLTAIVAIIIFALLVSAHEFGHFITAKLSGMYVQEFSIGMGPLVFAKQIGETKYSLRLLPLGGFVRVLGEDVEEEERSGIEVPQDIPAERRYQNRPVWQRIIFAAAGSFMNLVSAVVIFALMFMVAGEAIPIENPGTTISAVVENGPAHEAGMLPGDTIVKVDGIEYCDAEYKNGNTPPPVSKKHNYLSSLVSMWSISVNSWFSPHIAQMKE